MATRKRAAPAATNPAADAVPPGEAIATVKHRARRKNIPPAGLEAQGRVEESPPIRHHYNPHLPPVLRFADGAAAAESDSLPELLRTARQRPLSDEEAQTLARALRRHEPWLEWSGKREQPWFTVEPVALHIHERVSTQAMLRASFRTGMTRLTVGLGLRIPVTPSTSTSAASRCEIPWEASAFDMKCARRLSSSAITLTITGAPICSSSRHIRSLTVRGRKFALTMRSRRSP